MKSHECGKAEDIKTIKDDIRTIKKDIHQLSKDLAIRTEINGHNKERMEEIGVSAENADNKLWTKIDNLQDLMIKFMIAIITIVGTFMAVITFLLVYLK